MKTWIKRTLFGLFATGALLGGVAACSHGGHRHGWHAMSDADMSQMTTRLLDRAASKLDLDKAQKAKLGVLAERMQAQRKAFLGSSADPRADLQALISGPTFDRARAATLIEGKVGAVQSQSPAVVAAMADFYDSLKPEQQAKLRSVMAQRGHRG